MTEFPTDQTSDSSSLISLHGKELDSAIESRFSVVGEDVQVGDRCYSLRKPANADHLISEADYVMDERLPYWADLWPASRQLAAELLNEKGSGRTLLELGCGLGLASIAGIEAGFAVTASDYYEDALHVTRANAFRNTGKEPEVRMVNWRAWPTDIGKFDVVVAADVIYEKEYASLVARCMSYALADNGVAIVADPGRLALSEFLNVLPQFGLAVSSQRVESLIDGATTREIQIIRIRHSAKSVGVPE